MMLDKEHQLASAMGTGTLAADTKLFTTNAIDLWRGSALGTPPTGSNVLTRDVSQGEEMYAVFTITTIFDMANAAGTWRFSIGTATATDGTGYLASAAGPELTEAGGAAGLRVVVPLSGQPMSQRYLVGALENTGPTHAFVSGNFSCELHFGRPQTNPA